MSENMNPIPPIQILNITNAQGKPTPFAFRPGTSDVNVMESIFKGQEYALPIQGFQPKLILDCGGNIGAAAVYFANKYPDAQIYSIEPEKDNFEILKYNTKIYENIHPVNAGLWDKETFIRVEDRGLGNWGFMTFETNKNDPAAMKTTTISKILKDSGFAEIDLLKIDIEGAEKEVFGAKNVEHWLPKVKVLVIELHDRMKRGCSYAFFKAISKYHWHFTFPRGENLIFIRENILQ